MYQLVAQADFKGETSEWMYELHSQPQEVSEYEVAFSFYLQGDHQQALSKLEPFLVANPHDLLALNLKRLIEVQTTSQAFNSPKSHPPQFRRNSESSIGSSLKSL